MGTDIYLSWDKQTKEEEKSQVTGWSIAAGDRGYLRASIGMVNENHILRQVFPDKLWEGDGTPQRLKFSDASYGKVQRLGIYYLVAGMSGKALDKEDERLSSVKKMLVDKLGVESMQIGGDNMQFPSSIRWLDSLFAFWELGMEKESKGLNPKVYISY